MSQGSAWGPGLTLGSDPRGPPGERLGVDLGGLETRETMVYPGSYPKVTVRIYSPGVVLVPPYQGVDPRGSPRGYQGVP